MQLWQVGKSSLFKKVGKINLMLVTLSKVSDLFVLKAHDVWSTEWKNNKAR